MYTCKINTLLCLSTFFQSPTNKCAISATLKKNIGSKEDNAEQNEKKRFFIFQLIYLYQNFQNLYYLYRCQKLHIGQTFAICTSEVVNHYLRVIVGNTLPRSHSTPLFQMSLSILFLRSQPLLRRLCLALQGFYGYQLNLEHSQHRVPLLLDN